MTLRNQIIIAVAALSFTACDYSTKSDYNPNKEYKAFVKASEAAADKK